MSNCNFTSRNRRLDSELSHTSGVSALSNLTQSTEVQIDSDDSQSDYTDPNSSFHTVPHRLNIPVLNHSQNAPTMVNRNARTRQISFNLDDDDDSSPWSGAPIPVHFPRYDNRNMPPGNRRNRTRRATESSIPDIGVVDERCQMLHRSNTTTEFHNLQLERTAQLIAEHDARLREIENGRNLTSQRRSQSVNSLRSQDHIYTSLRPRPPVETVVSIPNTSDYLHPVTQVEVQPTDHVHPSILNGTDLFGDNASQISSKYARVDNADINSNQSCSEKNYRKGFYLLLVLNVTFILLNVVGLPFVYVTIQDHEAHREDKPNAEYATQQNQQLCIKCNSTNKNVKDFKTFGIRVGGDGVCCLPDLDVFIDGLNKKIEKMNTDQIDNAVFNTPILQLKSKSIHKDHKAIQWKSKPDIRLHGFVTTDEPCFIKIPHQGYYYIYTRVRFDLKVTSCVKHEERCTIGHEVLTKENHQILESFTEDVFLNNVTVLNHSSHLEFIHYFNEDDEIFIKPSHDEAEHVPDRPSVFGMFLLSE